VKGPPPFLLWREPTPRSLEVALLCAVAYANVSDSPLTLEEMHRYLVAIEREEA
jgi:hypothetical protein